MQDLVKKHSEFISYPISLWIEKTTEKEVDDDEADDDDEPPKEDEEGKIEEVTDDEAKKDKKKKKVTPGCSALLKVSNQCLHGGTDEFVHRASDSGHQVDMLGKARHRCEGREGGKIFLLAFWTQHVCKAACFNT